MATNAKYIHPIMATHPGSILNKELKARGINQNDFAVVIGMSLSNLKDLLKGKLNITEGIAQKLQEALDIPSQNWINLQKRYFEVKKINEGNQSTSRDSITDRNVIFPSGLSFG